VGGTVVTKVWIVALGAAGTLGAVSASAHHSAAMFDHNRTVQIVGTLKSMSYMHPHAWISVIGSPNGKGPAKQWDIETVSPITLTRIGINKDTFKPGDRLTVVAYPMHDGRNAGSLQYLTDASGRVYGWKPVEEADSGQGQVGR
jgi:hypothetical protein